MILPNSWVDRIFTKLTLTYGRAFLNQYEGLDIPMVKSDWAVELGGFYDKPNAIAHALANLPDKPVNVRQFRALCHTLPPEIFKALPPPKRTPEEMAKIHAMLNEVRSKFTSLTHPEKD